MAAPVHQIMLKGAEIVLKSAGMVPRCCAGAVLVLWFLLYPNSIFVPPWGTPQVLKKTFCRRSIKNLYSSIGLSVLIKNITLFFKLVV